MLWKNRSLIITIREGVQDTLSLVFLAFDFFLLASLLSYSPHDPSWNVCVRGAPDNLMGFLGSCVSDVLFQWFGYGAWVWVFVGFGVFASGALGTAPFIWIRLGFFLSIFVSFVLAYFRDSLVACWGMYPPGIGAWVKDGTLSLWCVGGIFVYGVWCIIHFLKKKALITRSSSSSDKSSLTTDSFSKTFQNQEATKAHHAQKHLSELNPSSKMPQNNTSRVYTNNPETVLPPLEFLTRSSGNARFEQTNEQDGMTRLQTVLEEFGIRGQVLNARPGPVVTLYDFEPAAGVKSSRIISLSDDIARSMSALSARVALIPGKNLIGIELSNPHRHMVFLHDLFNSEAYTDFQGQLGLALGQDISGQPIVVDLTRMPHVLVAGTTGSGKSVGINSMILSLLYRLSPKQCKLILIDPKMLELAVYDGIPHLLTPVITDHKKALSALKWAVQEMELRYRKMSQLGVRNILGYNQKVQEAKNSNQLLSREVQLGFDAENRPCFQQQVFDTEFLPYIVIIVDEMADLMLVAGKELEILVQRLAQMARAAGIHLITATQRPSVDVITGTIKANFPTRISFQVSSKIDSRTILGEQGAESLLGQGDMLYMASGGRVTRIHGPFVSDEEIEKVVNFLKTIAEPEYIDVAVHEDEELTTECPPPSQQDALYQQAVIIVLQDRKVSTSYIQRQLQIGYNRAARIIEQMEKEGIISAPNHAGKREILSA